jgi:preprotein translocase subunit SecA
MTVWTKIFGDTHTRFYTRTRPVVAKINALEEKYTAFSEQQFSEETEKFKARISQGETLEDILPEAFALVREASVRTIGQRHYDVQLIGGIALHEGKIAEMRTGEGKTLVATLPAYLNALTGKGVHIVTVNDYLASRDAGSMGQIFAFLGLSVGVIKSDRNSFLYDATMEAPVVSEEDLEVQTFKVQHEKLRPCSRKQAYRADITYGTNNEFGFDYLRDNLAQSVAEIVQPGHHFAIVDEVDSILIDEARTPLIISSQAGDSEDLYTRFASMAHAFESGVDFTVDEKLKAVSVTALGIEKAEKLLGIENLYTERGIKYVHHLETAIRAKSIYHPDRDYVIRDGEVVIVDAFTGRLQPGRRWNDGLHQAVEAKEGVEIQKESRAVASITFQNFFRFYKKVAGMTGTAETSKEEFYKVYGLEVVSIPTHRAIARVDHTDLIFQTEKGKFKAIARKVKTLQEKGQPVLIGTVSIEKNELLSAYLSQEGVKHTVLNAKNHEREGEIIAQAGRKGSVVVATNMAGRGVDIKLGGVPGSDDLYNEIKSFGGLFVLGTERHDARRIDNQLRGRTGRQGDPGETQFYVSLEDDLMRVFGSDRIKTMMGRFGIPEDEPIENRFIASALESAQAKIEGFNFDARKHTLEYDDVMNYQRKIVYERRRAMLLAGNEQITAYLDTLILEDESRRAMIDKKRHDFGEQAFLDTVRRIVLHITDTLWVEHLESMDYLRSSVNLRAYGQREPLVEYKKEGLRMFKDMEQHAVSEVINLIENLSSIPPAETVEPVLVTDIPETHDQEIKKVGRNDVCPCGSGKKYKKCHGKDA